MGTSRKMATVGLGMLALTFVACGGSLETEESASEATSPLLVKGTVFWGPSATDVVDRAYVRVESPDRAYRCFTTRCDGTFVVRRRDFPALQLPARVSVERVRDPDVVDQPPFVIRRVLEPVERFGTTVDVHLFNDDEHAESEKLAPAGSCAPGAKPELVLCPEDRR